MDFPARLPQLNLSPQLAAAAWGLEKTFSSCYMAAGTRMALTARQLCFRALCSDFGCGTPFQSSGRKS